MKNTLEKLLKKLIEIDSKASDKLNHFENDLLDSFFISITALGSLYFISFIAAVLIQTSHQSTLLELLKVIVPTAIITKVIKISMKRERPDKSIRRGYIFENYSFPSGHSANSFGTAIVLTGFSGLGYLPLFLAGLVAFSRVYLKRHYVSDVLVGIGIGTLAAILV